MATGLLFLELYFFSSKESKRIQRGGNTQGRDLRGWRHISIGDCSMKKWVRRIADLLLYDLTNMKVREETFESE